MISRCASRHLHLHRVALTVTGRYAGSRGLQVPFIARCQRASIALRPCGNFENSFSWIYGGEKPIFRTLFLVVQGSAKRWHQVWWIRFLLSCITSFLPCLQHSRNLRPIFWPSPVDSPEELERLLPLLGDQPGPSVLPHLRPGQRRRGRHPAVGQRRRGRRRDGRCRSGRRRRRRRRWRWRC